MTKRPLWTHNHAFASRRPEDLAERDLESRNAPDST
jgi:hypothetical protein